MIAEDRIARIESDVAEIKDDVKVVNVRLNESIVANAREFGAVRAELAEHRADTEKGFGGIRVEAEKNRTEIEKVRTAVESAKLTVIVTGVGVIAAVLGAATYLHTLKIP